MFHFQRMENDPRNIILLILVVLGLGDATRSELWGFGVKNYVLVHGDNNAKYYPKGISIKEEIKLYNELLVSEVVQTGETDLVVGNYSKMYIGENPYERPETRMARVVFYKKRLQSFKLKNYNILQKKVKAFLWSSKVSFRKLVQMVGSSAVTILVKIGLVPVCGLLLVVFVLGPADQH